MKTMCPPGYHHNGFVATHALGHHALGHHALGHALGHLVPKCMSCHKTIVVITNGHHVPKYISYHDAIDRLVITGRAHCLPF